MSAILNPPVEIMQKFAHLPAHMQLNAAIAYQAITLSMCDYYEIKFMLSEINKAHEDLPRLIVIG